MSEKTTCSSCRHFDADDKGRPVNGEGHVVGLCQLTRPKVEERIEKKEAKGIAVDEDLCPKCHHDVGDHVATNDDGMYSHYPPFSPVSLFRCVCSFPLLPSRWPLFSHTTSLGLCPTSTRRTDSNDLAPATYWCSKPSPR